MITRITIGTAVHKISSKVLCVFLDGTGLRLALKRMIT